MPYDVLLVGDYWYDLIFTDLPRLPELGRHLFATGFENVPGGPFINAVALHRLGLRVGWAADFGNDPFSLLALQAARREGLDEALFVHHERPYRRVTAVASYQADRALMSFGDQSPRVPAGLKALLSTQARLMLIPGLFYGPTFDGGQWLLRLRGMQVVMDCQFTGHSLKDPALRRALARVDVFMPNAVEARDLTGAATTLDALRALGGLCRLVVVKDGANGSYALRGGEVMHAPALSVTVVDTTGAGDCFSAGFVRAWLDERPLIECLRWGNICGALSTRALGGATAAPTLAEVQAWLRNQNLPGL